MIREMVNAGLCGEISNSKDSVRHHIYHFTDRDPETNKTWKSHMFLIYQTGRHGPQNGYRLCLVHEGFYITSPEKAEGAPEDEIDKAERPIPQGHEEMIILGEPPVYDDWEYGDAEDASSGEEVNQEGPETAVD